MTSRSWQYISRHWDACSNHSAISDFITGLAWLPIVLLTKRSERINQALHKTTDVEGTAEHVCKEEEGSDTTTKLRAQGTADHIWVELRLTLNVLVTTIDVLGHF